MDASAEVSYVVTPEGAGSTWRDLWRRRGVVASLALREVQVRYRHAALGFLWAVAQPLALAVVTSAVLRRPVDGVPYLVFAFTGLLAWTYFQTAVSSAVPSLVANAHLVRKMWFPRAALPLASVAAGLLDLGAALVAWAVIAPLAGVVPTAAALWTVVPLVLLVALTAAVALLGAATDVAWRDVKHALPLLLQVLLFATPILYPISALPEAWRSVVAWNPLTGVVEGLRDALVRARAPDPALLGPSAAVTAALLALAHLRFRAAERRFADVV